MFRDTCKAQILNRRSIYSVIYIVGILKKLKFKRTQMYFSLSFGLILSYIYVKKAKLNSVNLEI